MGDPILDSMFEGEEMEQEESRPIDPEYGKGKWSNAVLREVTPGKVSDYSHTILLRLDLKGDEGMPFTIFADAPFAPEENGDHDKYERAVRGYGLSLNKLKTLIHATGQWVEFNEKGYAAKKSWPKSLNDFKDEGSFQKLVEVFNQLVGSKMPVNVKFRKYTKRDGGEGYAKDVWGMDPKAE